MDGKFDVKGTATEVLGRDTSRIKAVNKKPPIRHFSQLSVFIKGSLDVL